MHKLTLSGLLLVILIPLTSVVFSYQDVSSHKEVIIPRIIEEQQNSKESQVEVVDESSLFVSRKQPFSVVLLGIDRRSKSEVGFRTDVIMVASVNQETNKLVLTSIPRDLWIRGSRINAIMSADGWDELKSAIYETTGMEAKGYIQCDFEDLVWIIDALGGVEIDLENSFTDIEYPNDKTKTYTTISFESGTNKIDGTQALQLSRSRHGNNGEGSDFKRMVRQHKILQAIPNAILSPKTIFNPFTIEKFYTLVTERMVTNLTLSDAKVLWDFYKDRELYKVEDFYVDSEFLYNPPMSEYGGAWVLVPKTDNPMGINERIKELLGQTPTKSALGE